MTWVRRCAHSTSPLLLADVDLERARDKDLVIPDEYELYLFGHRRPDLYGALVEDTVTA